MNSLARRIALVSIARPWVTITLWALLAIGLTVGVGAVGRDYSDSLEIPGSDSARAAELLGALDEGGGSRLVIGSSEPLVGGSAQAAVGDLITDVSDALGVPLVNPLDDPSKAAASGAISPDGKGLSIGINIDASTVTASQEASALAAIDRAEDAGLDAAFSGELARSFDSVPSHRSEVIGLIAAVIVLTLALGSLVAMAVPVGAGLLAVASGLGLLGLTTHVTSIPEIAPTLATMIGLGVGIDYALFQVTRLRRALGLGASPRDAVLETAASAGAAAAFAGMTVAVAITALAISGVSFIGWLGYGSAIVVLVVVAAALTFTPALLMVLAPRLKPARRKVRAGSTSEAPQDAKSAQRRGFSETVVAHPWLTGTAALLLLGILAIPAASLTLGMTGPGDRAAQTQAHQSFDMRAEHWGEGANATLTAVVELDGQAAGPEDPTLMALDEALATVGAASATPFRPVPGNPSVATSTVTPVEGANASSTERLLEDMRAISAPEGASLHVGGATATRIDLANQVTERLPWLMVAVVTASTLLLIVAFRSIVIPLKAAAMNLLSVAASYGVVVGVFQWGWGASTVGLDGPVAIDSFVPMILFTVLFGLSTDYEVFLVSSMREEWDRSHDARAAIVSGMRASGKVITTAAVIMVAVFVSFIAQPDPTIKIFGLGLAASIALDATVIRMLLVPAAMRLLGNRAWWLPAWLDKVLPRIQAH